MANRSYLYTMDKVTAGYADRPNKITGLSEFNYHTPTGFYLMVSDEAQLCPSLLLYTDAFPVYAMCGRSDKGIARLQHVADCMIRSDAIPDTKELEQGLAEMNDYLATRKLPYMYLEFAELDSMTAADGPEFKRMADEHLARANMLAKWADGLTPETVKDALGAVGVLNNVVNKDGHVDAVRDDGPVHPLGITYWSEVLYFAPVAAADWTEDMNP